MRSLALSLIDLIQNSLDAGADLVKVIIRESTEDKELFISVEDNGAGMTEEQAKQAEDPFFTTKADRSVGLGIALFKQRALLTGGSFGISSAVGRGTAVNGVFKTDSVDFVPLGDLESAIECVLLASHSDFVFDVDTRKARFAFDTRAKGGREIKNNTERI